MEKIFKPIPGYDGRYSVSNYGDVISHYYLGKKRDKILKQNIAINGYLVVSLVKNNKGKTLYVHTLVAMAFLGHIPCRFKVVVDHIDNNKLNNRLDNIQLTTNRHNASKDKDKSKTTSKYIGVNFNKHANKYYAGIVRNGKLQYLGGFTCEIEASKAYKKALENLNNQFYFDSLKPKYSSQYKGVCFDRTNQKFKAYIHINGKRQNIGTFQTELEAYNAYQNKLNELL